MRTYTNARGPVDTIQVRGVFPPMDTITAPRYAPWDRFLRAESHEPSSWTEHLVERLDRMLLRGRTVPARPAAIGRWPSSSWRGRGDRSDSAPSRAASPRSAGQVESAERVQAASVRREIQAQAIALASGSSISAMQPVPAYSSRPRGADSVEFDGSRKKERIEVARQPGSPFTIALANETLQDVALRVYGSGTVADSLWRANRDALARRDSPLSAGMVLRTPVLLTQSPLRK